MTDPNAPASEMTIRERFAMAALEGIHASGSFLASDLYRNAAAAAVVQADALIAALNNKQPANPNTCQT